MKTMSRPVAHSAVIVAVVGVCLAGCGFSARDLAEQINSQSGQSQPDSPAGPSQPRQDSPSTPAAESQPRPARPEEAREDVVPAELLVSPDQFDPEIDGEYLIDRGRWYGWNRKTNEVHFVVYFRDLDVSHGATEPGQPSGYTIDWADDESFGIKFNSPSEIQIWGKPYSLRNGRVFLLVVRGEEAEVQKIREPIVYVDSPIPDLRIPKTVNRLDKRPRIKEFMSVGREK